MYFSKTRCLGNIGHGHTPCAFGLIDDKDAVQTSHTRDGAERVEHELLVGFHVTCVHLNQEVEVTARVVAFRDFVDMLYGIHELLDQLLCVLFQSDVAEHQDAVAHLLRVHHNHIPLYIPQSFQPLLPFKGGRGREVDARGQFLDRQMGVFLQNSQDFAVCLIE